MADSQGYILQKEINMTVNQFFVKIGLFEHTVYDIDVTNKFKKQIKIASKRNLDLQLLIDVIYILAKDEKLEEKYQVHTLSGFSEIVWECHVKPDWLLTWSYSDDKLVLILLETGTHSDLF